MISKISTAFLFAAMLAAGSGSTVADETGFAGIHNWQKVGKKTCLSGHSHAGNGSGANRKAAEAAAVQSWSSFTTTEYGSSWGDYRNAVSRTIACSPSGPGSVYCDIDAVPCRPY